MKPVYQATARLTIDRESTSSPITGQRTEYIDVQSQLLTFNTHFKLIKSKPVIESLIQALQLEDLANSSKENLASNPFMVVTNFILDAKSRLVDNIQLLLKREEQEQTEREKLDQEISDLQEQIEISQVRDTRLLTIDVEDTNPEYAALIANLLAKKYIEFDLASRLSSANENLEWLNKEVYALKKRLEDDEKKFYEYKQENKVFSLSGKQKVIDQKITELNNEYILTRNKRQEIEAKLNEIEKKSVVSEDVAYIRSILNNKSIDEIYANLTNLELEYDRLKKVFKKKHPKIQQVIGEIAKVKAKLNTELQKEIENLKVERTVLLNREKVMEQNLSEFEEDALDTSSKELKYTILQRNMDTSQQLYDTLVAKIKESGVVSSGATSNVRVVEQATVPIDPVKPNKKKNVLLAIILGLFGGTGLAFFLEYLDQTIRTEEDVHNYLDLPVLSVVPIADKSEQGVLLMLKLNTTKNDLPGHDALLFNFSTKSRYAESFRTLRTNIYFALMEKELDSLMVTSSLQGEGKTNSVANLAFTIAQTGKRVLMVDADLRKPGLTSRFGMQKATGFSNLISDTMGRHINRGNVADYGMNDIIKLCLLQNRNCIISFNDGTNQTELTFLKGKLIDVYWINRPEEKNLRQH